MRLEEFRKIPEFTCPHSNELRSLFKVSVTNLVEAIEHQLTISDSDRETTVGLISVPSDSTLISSQPVWLVGGFASSPYLLKALQEAFETDGPTVQSPETHLCVNVFHWFCGLNICL